MAIKRREYAAKFKVRVALDAAREDRTTAEVGRKYGIHPNQAARWKSELLHRVSEIFEGGRRSVDVSTVNTGFVLDRFTDSGWTLLTQLVESVSFCSVTSFPGASKSEGTMPARRCWRSR